MNPKWLLITLLLLNLPTNTKSQLPTYEWNTTKLGVSIGDIFEYKLVEYSYYNGENDTYSQGNIFLNNTALFARENATEDEFLNVGETFSITIQSNPYFRQDLNFPNVQFELDGIFHELVIPLLNVTLTHNSFVAERFMETFLNSGEIPEIISNRFEGLIFIPDWEIYNLIYPDVNYNNQEIIDEDNFYVTNFTRNFEISGNTVTYDHSSYRHYSSNNRSIAPWTPGYQNSSLHAVIGRGTGVVNKIEWQIESNWVGYPSKIKISIENIDENTDNSPLGQNNYVSFSLTSFALLTLLQIRKKKEKTRI